VKKQNSRSTIDIFFPGNFNMAKKSKLLSALDAARGRDHEQERQKKLQKLARRRKRVNAGDEEEGKAEENGAEEVIMEVRYVSINPAFSDVADSISYRTQKRPEPNRSRRSAM
jgi:rRNA-processing protein EBP2